MSVSTKTKSDFMSHGMMGNEVYEKRNRSGPDSSLHPLPSREEGLEVKGWALSIITPIPCSENIGWPLFIMLRVAERDMPAEELLSVVG